MDKQPRPETAAMKQEGIQQEPHEDPWAGVREVSRWHVQQVTKDQELDIVQRSAPSKTEEEPTSRGGVRGARNVGEPATWDSFVPLFEKQNSG
jgi:hypothetical protein